MGDVNVKVVAALSDGLRDGPGEDDDSESVLVIGKNVIVCIASNVYDLILRYFCCVDSGWGSGIGKKEQDCALAVRYKIQDDKARYWGSREGRLNTITLLLRYPRQSKHVVVVLSADHQFNVWGWQIKKRNSASTSNTLVRCKDDATLTPCGDKDAGWRQTLTVLA